MKQPSFHGKCRYFLPVVAAVFIVSACKPRLSASQLSDEGLTGVEGKTIAEIVTDLINVHSLTEQESQLVKKHIERVVFSTFRIDCPENEGVGSAFWANTNGSFISAGHVILDSATQCKITMPELAADGRVTVRESIHDVEVRIGTYDGAFGDVVHGRVLGVDNQHWLAVKSEFPIESLRESWKRILEIDDASLQAEEYRKTGEKIDKIVANEAGDFVMGIGFPIDTLRDGNESNQTKDAYDFVIRDLHCDPRNLEMTARAYVDYLESIEDPIGKTVSEYLIKEKLRLEAWYQKAVCDYMEKKGPELRNSGYDVVGKGKLGLYITLGRTYGSSIYEIIADTDTLNGMSGGPLVQLSSGAAIGTLSRGIIGSNAGDQVSIIQKRYVPDGIYSRVSKKILESVDSAEEFEKVGCWCDWKVKESDFGSDTVHVKTNFFACVPTGLEPGYYCKSFEGRRTKLGYKSAFDYAIYSVLENCRAPVTFRRSSCSFPPGSLIGVSQGGKYLGRKYVDAEIAEYLPTNE